MAGQFRPKPVRGNPQQRAYIIVDEFMKAHAKLLARLGTSAKVTIGFDAPYALWVHESTAEVLRGKPRSKKAEFHLKKSQGLPPIKRRVGNFWDPKGESKFLEKAFRTVPVTTILINATKKTTFIDGLAEASRRVLQNAMARVPIESGYLLSSAFMEVHPVRIVHTGVIPARVRKFKGAKLLFPKRLIPTYGIPGLGLSTGTPIGFDILEAGAARTSIGQPEIIGLPAIQKTLP